MKRFKKILVGGLAFLAACCSVCALSSCSLNEERQEEYVLSYELSEDGSYYIVTGVIEGNMPDLVIPSEYAGKPVKEIKEAAIKESWRSKDYIKNVVIEEGITKIGIYAFFGLNITSITLPDSVTNIGERAFEDTEYYNDESNWENGVLYIGKHLIKAKDTNANGNPMLGKYTIKEGTIYIAEGAFSDSENLRGVTIPNSVKKIDSCAFSNCDNLESVTIGEVVEEICYHAFSSCDSLTSVVIPENVTVIGEGAFGGRALTVYCEVASEPSGWAVGDWSWFSSSSDDEPVIVWDCDNNDEDEYGHSYTVIDGLRYSIERYAGRATVISQPKNIIKADIPSKITYKGTEYPVTDISSEAFSKGYMNFCDKLTEVYIPDSITDIRYDVFFELENLTDIYVSDNNENYTSIDGVLYDKEVTGLLYYPRGKMDTEFVIPYSVEGISEYAFNEYTNRFYNDGLTSITLGASVSYIYGLDILFEKGFLTEIEVDKENENYSSIDGNLYSKDGTCLLRYARGKKDTKFVIPNGVTEIGTEAFCNCTNLTEIKISTGVNAIGWRTFADCENLVNITIADTVTDIGAGAFYNTGYYNNEDNWEGGVLYIGKHLIEAIVEEDSDMETYNIKEGTLSIASNTFLNFTRVIMPNSVIVISAQAFFYCGNLKEIVISDSVTKIGNSAFEYCENLSNIYYMGTAEQWDNINSYFGLNEDLGPKIYYYCESAPTVEGNYWHYVEGKPTAWEI